MKRRSYEKKHHVSVRSNVELSPSTSKEMTRPPAKNTMGRQQLRSQNTAPEIELNFEAINDTVHRPRSQSLNTVTELKRVMKKHSKWRRKSHSLSVFPCKWKSNCHESKSSSHMIRESYRDAKDERGGHDTQSDVYVTQKWQLESLQDIERQLADLQYESSKDRRPHELETPIPSTDDNRSNEFSSAGNYNHNPAPCKQTVRVEGVKVKNLLEQERQVYKYPATSRKSQYMACLKIGDSGQTSCQFLNSLASLTNAETSDEWSNNTMDPSPVSRSTYHRQRSKNQMNYSSSHKDEETITSLENRGLKMMAEINNNGTNGMNHSSKITNSSERSRNFIRSREKSSHLRDKSRICVGSNLTEDSKEHPQPLSHSSSVTTETSESCLVSDNNSLRPSLLDYSYTLSSTIVSNTKSGTRKAPKIESTPTHGHHNGNVKEDGVIGIPGHRLSLSEVNEYKKTALEILLQRKLDNEARLGKTFQKSEKSSENLKARKAEKSPNCYTASTTRGTNEQRLSRSPVMKRFPDQKPREMSCKRETNTRVPWRTSPKSCNEKLYGSSRDLTSRDRIRNYQRQQSFKRQRSALTPRGSISNITKDKRGISPKPTTPSKKALNDFASACWDSPQTKHEVSPDPNPSSKSQNDPQNNTARSPKCLSAQKQEPSVKTKLSPAEHETGSQCQHLELIQSILKSPTARAVQALGQFYKCLENKNEQSTKTLTQEMDITVDDILRRYQDILAESTTPSSMGSLEDVSIRRNQSSDRDQPEMLQDGGFNSDSANSTKNGKCSDTKSWVSDQSDYKYLSLDTRNFMRVKNANKTRLTVSTRPSFTIESPPLNSDDLTAFSMRVNTNSDISNQGPPDGSSPKIHRANETVDSKPTRNSQHSKESEDCNRISTPNFRGHQDIPQAPSKNILNKEMGDELLFPGLSQVGFPLGSHVPQLRTSDHSAQTQQTVHKVASIDVNSEGGTKKPDVYNCQIPSPETRSVTDNQPRRLNQSSSFSFAHNKDFYFNPLKLSPARNRVNPLKKNVGRRLLGNNSQEDCRDIKGKKFDHISNVSAPSTREKACSPFDVMSVGTVANRGLENMLPKTKQTCHANSQEYRGRQKMQFAIQQSPLLKRKIEKQARGQANVFNACFSGYKPYSGILRSEGKLFNAPSGQRKSRRDTATGSFSRNRTTTTETNAENLKYLVKMELFPEVENQVFKFSSARKSDEEIVPESSSDEQFRRRREVDYSAFELHKMGEAKKKLGEGLREKLKSKQAEGGGGLSRYWMSNGPKHKKTYGSCSASQSDANRIKDKDHINFNMENFREKSTMSHDKKKLTLNFGPDISASRASSTSRLAFRKTLNAYLKLRKDTLLSDQFEKDYATTRPNLSANMLLPHVNEGIVKSHSASLISSGVGTKDQYLAGRLIKDKGCTVGSVTSVVKGFPVQFRPTISQPGRALRREHIPFQSLSVQTICENGESKTKPKVRGDEVESSEDDTTSGVRSKIVRKTCLKILEERRQQFQHTLVTKTDSKSSTQSASSIEDASDSFHLNKLYSRNPGESKISMSSVSSTKTRSRSLGCSLQALTGINSENKMTGEADMSNRQECIDFISASIGTRQARSMESLFLPPDVAIAGKSSEMQNCATKDNRQTSCPDIAIGFSTKGGDYEPKTDEPKIENRKEQGCEKNADTVSGCQTQPKQQQSHQLQLQQQQQQRQQQQQQQQQQMKIKKKQQEEQKSTTVNSCLESNIPRAKLLGNQHTYDDEHTNWDDLAAESVELNVSGHAYCDPLRDNIRTELCASKTVVSRGNQKHVCLFATVYDIIARLVENARASWLFMLPPYYRYLNELTLSRESTSHGKTLLPLLARTNCHLRGWEMGSTSARRDLVQKMCPVVASIQRQCHEERGGPPMKHHKPLTTSNVTLGERSYRVDGANIEPAFRTCQDSVSSDDRRDTMVDRANTMVTLDEDLPKIILTPAISVDFPKCSALPHQSISKTSSIECVNTDQNRIVKHRGCRQHLRNRPQCSQPHHMLMSILLGRVVLIQPDVDFQCRLVDQCLDSDDVSTTFEEDSESFETDTSSIRPISSERSVHTTRDSNPDENVSSDKMSMSLLALESREGEDISAVSMDIVQFPVQNLLKNQDLMHVALVTEIQECSNRPIVDHHNEENARLTRINSVDDVSGEVENDHSEQKSPHNIKARLNVKLEEEEGSLNLRELKEDNPMVTHGFTSDPGDVKTFLSANEYTEYIEDGCKPLRCTEALESGTFDTLHQVHGENESPEDDSVHVNRFLSYSEHAYSIETALKSLACKENDGENVNKVLDQANVCGLPIEEEKAPNISFGQNGTSMAFEQFPNPKKEEKSTLTVEKQSSPCLKQGKELEQCKSITHTQSTEYNDASNVIPGKEDKEDKEDLNVHAPTFEMAKLKASSTTSMDRIRGISKYHQKYPSLDVDLDQTVRLNSSVVYVPSQLSLQFSDSVPSNCSSQSGRDDDVNVKKDSEIFTKQLDDIAHSSCSDTEFKNVPMSKIDTFECFPSCYSEEANFEQFGTPQTVESMSQTDSDSLSATNELSFRDIPHHDFSDDKAIDADAILHSSVRRHDFTPNYKNTLTMKSVARGLRTFSASWFSKFGRKRCKQTHYKTLVNRNAIRSKRKWSTGWPNNSELGWRTKISYNKRRAANDSKMDAEQYCSFFLPCHDSEASDLNWDLLFPNPPNTRHRHGPIDTPHRGGQCVGQTKERGNNDLMEILLADVRKEKKKKMRKRKKTLYGRGALYTKNGMRMEPSTNAAEYNHFERAVADELYLNGYNEYHLESDRDLSVGTMEIQNNTFEQDVDDYATFEALDCLPKYEMHSKKRVKFFTRHANAMHHSGQLTSHRFYDDQRFLHVGVHDSDSADHTQRSKSTTVLDMTSCDFFSGDRVEPQHSLFSSRPTDTEYGRRGALSQHVVDPCVVIYAEDSYNPTARLKQNDGRGGHPVNGSPRAGSFYWDNYLTRNASSKLQHLHDLHGGLAFRRSYCSSCRDKDKERMMTLSSSDEVLEATSNSTTSDTYGDVGSLVTELVDSYSSLVTLDFGQGRASGIQPRGGWLPGARGQVVPSCKDSMASKDRGLNTAMASCLVTALEHVLSRRFSPRKVARKSRRLKRLGNRRAARPVHSHSYSTSSHRSLGRYRRRNMMHRRRLSSPLTRSKCRTHDTNTLAQVSSLPEDEVMRPPAMRLDNNLKIKRSALESIAMPRTNDARQDYKRNMTLYYLDDGSNNRAAASDDDNAINLDRQKTPPKMFRYHSDAIFRDGADANERCQSDIHYQIPINNCTARLSLNFRTRSNDCEANISDLSLSCDGPPKKLHSYPDPFSLKSIDTSKEINSDGDIEVPERPLPCSKTTTLFSFKKMNSPNPSHVANNLCVNVISPRCIRGFEKRPFVKSMNEFPFHFFNQKGKDSNDTNLKLIKSKSDSDIRSCVFGFPLQVTMPKAGRRLCSSSSTIESHSRTQTRPQEQRHILGESAKAGMNRYYNDGGFSVNAGSLTDGALNDSETKNSEIRDQFVETLVPTLVSFQLSPIEDLGHVVRDKNLQPVPIQDATTREVQENYDTFSQPPIGDGPGGLTLQDGTCWPKLSGGNKETFATERHDEAVSHDKPQQHQSTPSCKNQSLAQWHDGFTLKQGDSTLPLALEQVESWPQNHPTHYAKGVIGNELERDRGKQTITQRHSFSGEDDLKGLHSPLAMGMLLSPRNGDNSKPKVQEGHAQMHSTLYSAKQSITQDQLKPLLPGEDKMYFIRETPTNLPPGLFLNLRNARHRVIEEDFEESVLETGEKHAPTHEYATRKVASNGSIDSRFGYHCIEYANTHKSIEALNSQISIGRINASTKTKLNGAHGGTELPNKLREDIEDQMHGPEDIISTHESSYQPLLTECNREPSPAENNQQQPSREDRETTSGQGKVTPFDFTRTPGSQSVAASKSLTTPFLGVCDRQRSSEKKPFVTVKQIGYDTMQERTFLPLQGESNDLSPVEEIIGHRSEFKQTMISQEVTRTSSLQCASSIKVPAVQNDTKPSKRAGRQESVSKMYKAGNRFKKQTRKEQDLISKLDALSQRLSSGAADTRKSPSWTPMANDESKTRKRGSCMLRQRVGFKYRFHPFSVSRETRKIKCVDSGEMSKHDNVSSEHQSYTERLLARIRRNRRLNIIHPSQAWQVCLKWTPCHSQNYNSPSCKLGDSAKDDKDRFRYVLINRRKDGEIMKIEDQELEMRLPEFLAKHRFFLTHTRSEDDTPSTMLTSHESSIVSFDMLTSNVESKRNDKVIGSRYFAENVSNAVSTKTSELSGGWKVNGSNQDSLRHGEQGKRMGNSTDEHFQPRGEAVMETQKRGKSEANDVEGITPTQALKERITSNQALREPTFKLRSIPCNKSGDDMIDPCVDSLDRSSTNNDVSTMFTSSKRADALDWPFVETSSGFPEPCVSQDSDLKQRRTEKTGTQHQDILNKASLRGNTRQILGESYSYYRYDDMETDQVVIEDKLTNHPCQNNVSKKTRQHDSNLRSSTAPISLVQRNLSHTAPTGMSSSQANSQASFRASTGVQLEKGTPYEIVRNFLSQKMRPVQIPVDIYPFPSKCSAKRGNKTHVCSGIGNSRTVAISGPLMNLNLPVYHHERELQHRQRSSNDAHAPGLARKADASQDAHRGNRSNSNERRLRHQATGQSRLNEEEVNFGAKRGRCRDSSDRVRRLDIDHTSSKTSGSVYHFTDESPRITQRSGRATDDALSRHGTRSFNQIMKKLFRIRKS